MNCEVDCSAVSSQGPIKAFLYAVYVGESSLLTQGL